MVKKIFFYPIFLSFLFYVEAFASDNSGMPQLNPEFWISQIFWLTITFGILYILLSKLILPKISNNLEIRKSQILENIEAAEKQREESEKKIKEYEEIVKNVKSDAKNYFMNTKSKITEDVNKKREALDKELNEEINKADLEIKDLINKAPEKINKIAIETSADLVRQLIGAEINNSSISAIVEDLSSKNKEKYYGN